MVVVTRYFGGVLLGANGWSGAYGQACKPGGGGNGPDVAPSEALGGSGL